MWTKFRDCSVTPGGTYSDHYGFKGSIYEACPESKDTKVLNMYNIFNLQKRHYERTACT